MMPQAAILPGGRLHLTHGPIDLVIGVDGDRARAFDAAEVRFATLLEELTAELSLLRRPVGRRPAGAIARAMHAAALPHADGTTTPMIAVAGSVAQAVLAAMVEEAEMTRAYVNNGGDIALHLSGEARFRVGLATPEGAGLGHVDVTSRDPVRGVATSGQGGRSLSLGIADAVTVLARNAAMADAAATRIANAVDLPGHAAILRVPASDIHDDSDLGETPVVRHVGLLSGADVAAALRRGQAVAAALRRAGLIDGAALFLRGRSAVAGMPGALPQAKERVPCLTS